VLQECISAESSLKSSLPSCSSIRDTVNATKKDAADSPRTAFSQRGSKTYSSSDNELRQSDAMRYKYACEKNAGSNSSDLGFAAQGLSMAFSVVNDIIRCELVIDDNRALMK
jgi:hypothetical protein